METFRAYKITLLTSNRRLNGPVSRYTPQLLPLEGNLATFIDIASDGSYDPVTNTAGVGMSTGYVDFVGTIPGKQGIDRAEAFGVLACCRMARSSCTVFSDSKSTLDLVKKVSTLQFQPSA